MSEEEKIPTESSVKDIYDSAPFPHSLRKEPSVINPILIPWINAANSRGSNALGPFSRILIAGCGSGEEAFTFSDLYPSASILAIDFSEKSIAFAKKQQDLRRNEKIQFKVADLLDTSWLHDEGEFDFILCQHVADYVQDIDQLLKTMSYCLGSNGVLCMMVNTPFHPAKIIREHFQSIGIPISDFSDSLEHRAILEEIVLANDLQTRIPLLWERSYAYLRADIFSPIAHHLSLEEWYARAEQGGLKLIETLDLPMGIASLGDEKLASYYSFNRIELSRIMAEKHKKIATQMLFTKKRSTEPDFADLKELLHKTFVLDESFVGLPEMKESPFELRALSLRFPGIPDLKINSTAFDLEVLRRLNGKKTIYQILKDFESLGDLESLRRTLFRSFHFGLLRNID